MPTGTIRLIDHDPRRGSRCVTVIGAGPRGVGWLERFVENHPEYGSMPLVVHLVDPHPVGGGKIWRDEQSGLLKLNSLAADVTMFTDETSTIEGPVAPGPSLVEWAEGVRDGSIDDVDLDREAEPELAEELEALGPGSFPTRRLQERYLSWFFRRAAAKLAAGSRIMIHPTSVTAVMDQANGTQRVHLADGSSMTTDVVLYALGHTESEPSAESAALLEFAEQHGLAYQQPAYTADADLARFMPGEPVLVRGMGLAAIDLLVLLGEGRGGRYEPAPELGPTRLRYVPSGLEPRILIGSRRGVPYHAKPTAPLAGDVPSCRYVTAGALAKLLDRPARVDFRDDLLPLIHKELLYGVARELFTGHPERTRGSFDDLVAVLDAHRADSDEVRRAVAAAIPDARDRFDLAAFDRPLAGREFADHETLQEALREYVRDDLYRRSSPEQSATTAMFFSLLYAYMALVDVTDHPNWTARSIATMYGQWHHFFSYVASGPPGHRLEELLALSEAGIVEFLGGDVRIVLDEGDGERRDAAFVATGAHLAEPVRASALIDAWLPDADAETSLNAALRDLVDSGVGKVHVHDDGRDVVSTGRIEVRSSDSRIVRPDGTAHPRRFAIGAYTSAPFVGAFSRPRTNAVAFRENDTVARAILEVLRTRNDAAVCLAEIGPEVEVFDGVVLV
ncbi:adenylate cyclase [Pseudoclavibacter endophyticus]|uniref:Adenylate cyclase n=1 Tax=Pseudoclavibacter endophyticus TaxID=1778590 RepID=A0A6H9WRN0_9MICO|nr:FAD/NAD(P)-binding domain-containing protein [Pseudoclavibacter endophyticus]KAB1650281.1 adenylate cyclase [Pseudoclavibacter endophyticus]GGA55513.1 adenylate cyclase [Pseudoclavibacter endophyticus]